MEGGDTQAPEIKDKLGRDASADRSQGRLALGFVALNCVLLKLSIQMLPWKQTCQWKAYLNTKQDQTSCLQVGFMQ